MLPGLREYYPTVRRFLVAESELARLASSGGGNPEIIAEYRLSDPSLIPQFQTAHDPACAARGDRVIYLRDGLLVDSRELGPWTRARATDREDQLLGWLREQGF